MRSSHSNSEESTEHSTTAKNFENEVEQRWEGMEDEEQKQEFENIALNETEEMENTEKTRQDETEDEDTQSVASTATSTATSYSNNFSTSTPSPSKTTFYSYLFARKSKTSPIPFDSFDEVQEEQWKNHKILHIEYICNQESINLSHVRDCCCTNYGLVKDRVREAIWPKLLGISEPIFSQKRSKDVTELATLKLTQHEQYEQVEKDVERSLWKFTKHANDLERQFKRKQLSRIMNAILCQPASTILNSHENLNIPPHLFYFQGFHDICTIFLFICGESVGYICVKQLVKFYFRDVMLSNRLDFTLQQLKLIYLLVDGVDPEVSAILRKSDNDEGHYAISWILTWFSHVIDDLLTVARLFDLFLATHPLMPVYLAATVVLHRKSELLELPCEFSSVFGFLNRFPNQVDHCLPWEELIQSALQIFEDVPPEKLLEQAAQELHVEFPTHSILFEYPFSYMENEMIKPDPSLTLGTLRKRKYSTRQFEANENKFQWTPHKQKLKVKQEKSFFNNVKRIAVLSATVALSIGISYFVTHHPI